MKKITTWACWLMLLLSGTAFAQAPANDVCSGAIAITCGDTLFGSTDSATVDTTTIFCGTTPQAPGVWFEFTAPSNTNYEVNTCTGSTFDTKVNVYEGSCGNFTCVAGDDDDCGVQSRVPFSGTAGTTYYIYVNGFGINTGDFGLELICLPPPPPPPANDTCAGAIAVACGDTVYGSTEFATFDNAGTCGTSNTAPGVWYSFAGNGGVMTADLCSDSSDFDTKISIFTGDCDSLICVDGNDDFCGTRSAASALTIDGETYFILVHGFSANTGNFGLAIGCPPPANDSCNAAITINCGDTLAGTTVNATADGSLPFCGTSITAPGVWYEFNATVNTNYEANLCFNGDYDTKMNIFEGDCDSLICVGGNDDFCGLQSGTTWSGTAGTTYYIFVQGFSNNTGTFELAMNCLPPPPGPPANDTCGAAIAVACGDTVFGSTEFATFDNAGTCNTSNTAPGVWYSFVGTGGDLSIDLCSDSTDYDSKLSLYTGDCDSLICVGGNDDFCGTQSGLTAVTNAGQDYFILVHGFSTNTGNFGLAVNCPPPANDSCNAAITINCGDTLSGTTVNATFDSTLSFCGTSIASAGVWYEFVAPSNTNYEANLCSNGTYDTKMNIFTGVCDSLICVGGNDDFCGLQSGTTWAGTAGTTYFIFVQGFNNATGPFDLAMNCLPPPPPPPANDTCGGAIAVACGDTVYGSTEFATFDNVGTCGTSNTAPGVWYSFQGNGGVMTADLCSDSTDYDTKISIFTGDCDSLICVDGNDDFCGTRSAASAVTMPGETYFILVHGFSTNTGNFGLAIGCPPPANDSCNAAASINCGDTLLGTTINATFDSSLTFCGTSITSAGVWYEFVAPNNTNYEANLCSNGTYDTKMNIYTGACDSLICVGGNDDFCGLQSGTTWAGTAGTTYFIFVQGFSGATGTFELAMNCLPPPPPPPANDTCGGAIAVACGDTVYGSTEFATFDNAGTCNTSNTAPGVWYSFVGTGGDLSIDLCSDSTDYDSKLSLYTGDCDSLICVDGNDDFCGTQSGLTAVTNAGQDYFILVHGFSTNTGNFGLAVNCPPPANDSCNAAITINCGDTLSGTTVNATFDSSLTTCTTSITSAGVWYEFVAPSNTNYEANLCSNGTYDTKMNIFTGACDSLICVGGNDDFCGLQSGTSWAGTAGTTYFIFVQGFSGATGTFDLAMNCLPPPPPPPANDTCGGAIPVACGDTVYGSTEFALVDTNAQNVVCGTSVTAPGVWYEFQGNGGVMTADLCSDSTDYDTKMSLFTGDCDSLICVDGNDDFCGLQSQVSGVTVPGETYYILVHGFSANTGNFGLAINCPPPANDSCNAAIAINCDDTLTGTTVNATFDSTLSFCGTSITSPGVWYEFTPATSGDFEANTCNNGTYDTKMNVFEGACDSLTCVGGNDDACGVQSSVTWTGTAGTTYFIFIQGFNGATGIFDLAMNCLPPPPPPPANDTCGGAIALSCGDFVQGSTEFATADTGLGTCGTSITAPGVWYSVDGTGGALTASLCDSTNYDSKISVFEGDCDSLVCVDGNDDFCGLQSQVSFATATGTTYYILVHGFSANVGDFGISISSGQTNQTCATATTVLSGDTILGSTVCATPDTVPTCVTGDGTGGGVWYQVDGTGNGLVASLCGGTNYDSKIRVFEGICDSLLCVTGNDDFCGLQSEASWCSEVGTTYFILVHGFSANEGSFTLTIADTSLADAGFNYGATAFCAGDAPVTPTVNQSGGVFTGPVDSITGVFDPSQLGTGAYLVTHTVVSGSCSATDSVVLTVGQAMVDIGPDPMGCASDTFCFDAGPGFVSYVWSNGATTQNTCYQGGGIVIVTVTDSNGCTASDTAEMIITPAPVAVFFVDSTLCPTISFVDSSMGAMNYMWDFGNGMTDTVANPSVTYDSNAVYNVTLMVSNACGSDSASASVNINCIIGIESGLAQYVSVYPNPTREDFFVEVTGLELEDLTIQVIGVEGKILETRNLEAIGALHREAFDLNGLAAGVYFVKIKSAGQEVVHRIMKM